MCHGISFTYKYSVWRNGRAFAGDPMFCLTDGEKRDYLVAPPFSNVREARLKTDKISVYAAVEIWSIEDIPKPLICSP